MLIPSFASTTTYPAHRVTPHLSQNSKEFTTHTKTLALYLSSYLAGRQNIKKICLLIFSKASAAAKKPPTFAVIDKFIACNLKVFFLFFFFDFLHIDPSNDFCFCKFFAKGLKSERERLKGKFWS
jgi:hypothetical protein